MSVWTHVAAIFRIDSMGEFPDDLIKETFGEVFSYGELPPDHPLPYGSEGSLQMSIWHNPDESSLASTTVSVFGDLRNYYEADNLKEWFYESCDKLDFRIRQAVMEVRVEGEGSRVCRYTYGDKRKEWCHKDDCTGLD